MKKPVKDSRVAALTVPVSASPPAVYRLSNLNLAAIFTTVASRLQLKMHPHVAGGRRQTADGRRLAACEAATVRQLAICINLD